MTTTLATLVFLATYALIITDKVHRTLAALAGGFIVIVTGVLSQEEAFRAIDLNVIFLLVGMMAIANILRETGLFQWLAVRSVKIGRGKPFAILVLLCTVTAVASAMMDNVTIVVLIAPVSLYIAATLGISPTPLLIAEALASNIGGTATLIGDPPNILVASAAGIDFTSFVLHMGPVAVLTFIAFLGVAWWIFGHSMRTVTAPSSAIMALDETKLITDPVLLRKGLIVLGLTLLGFLTGAAIHVEPASVAMLGAAALLIWGRHDPAHVLADVEWTTLFFFIGLFLVVEGLVAAGVIERIAHLVIALTHEDIRLTTLLLMWVSAGTSGIVDNIPYTATMIPLVQDLGQVMPIAPLWWALVLGADLGGNATLVGASANVVVSSVAARSGHPMTFRDFLKYGLPVTFVTMLVATAYVWLRYLN